ncbi:MAG: hypothetical protein GEU92_10105 [Alphaproteobacteria bacterium]|nr:hypothetical protein [Alphaproteobacteria bacterium]
MRWKLTGLIAAIATTLPVLSAAAQQPVCGEHETMVERLNGKFSEKRVGAGLGHDGQLVEVFAAPEGTTWSMLVTLPTGKACLVGAGEAWQMPDGANGSHAWLMPQR